MRSRDRGLCASHPLASTGERSSGLTRSSQESRYPRDVEANAWAVIIAGASLLVGAVALVLSGRAVRHARTSNTIAARALDIQTRGEDRRTEFRDVRWDLTVDRTASATGQLFTLRNVGTTEAHRVTMVFKVLGSDQSPYFGSIPADSSVQALPALMSGVERLKTLVELNNYDVRVQWTSAAGEAGDWQPPSRRAH